jgi:hypothetical protein
MTFTVTRATLENNGILFIRDVLQANLTDPIAATRNESQWVFKSPLKNTDMEMPLVVLDQSSCTENRITFRGGFEIDYNLGLMVWSKKLEERDDIADEIKVVLQDDSNTDGANSLYSQGLIYESCDSRNNDGYVDGFSELLRIKEMTIHFRYIR